MSFFHGIVKAPPEILPAMVEPPIYGCFADIVEGPHQGRYGVVIKEDGETITIRTRDADEEHLIVNPRHARPADPGRR
jgi:hypothetical protein